MCRMDCVSVECRSVSLDSLIPLHISHHNPLPSSLVHSFLTLLSLFPSSSHSRSKCSQSISNSVYISPISYICYASFPCPLSLPTLMPTPLIVLFTLSPSFPLFFLYSLIFLSPSLSLPVDSLSLSLSLCPSFLLSSETSVRV